MKKLHGIIIIFSAGGLAATALLAVRPSSLPDTGHSVVVAQVEPTVAPREPLPHREVMARLQKTKARIDRIREANAEALSASQRFDSELSRARALRAEVMKEVGDVRSLARLDEESRLKLAEAANIETQAQESWSETLSQIKSNNYRK